ncbi:oligosaccharide flippase family protein [Aliarcobacter cryaerophilus]|uniref:oligosaccharide flippase family protein n=1 Tax=Aliarcobacter cryaerophilus TaxID=28198 RepID=UPI00082C6A1A|nr:oligosaccharide flippase family protein [Aliarcobacter cryaerophilus]
MLKRVYHYLSGDILVKLLGFVSLPVYTFFLSPDEYGSFFIFLSYVVLGSVILTLNTHTSVGRFIYEKDINLGSFLYVTFLLTFAGIIFSTIVLFSIDRQYLIEVLQIDIKQYGVYLVILVLLNTIINIYNQILQAERRSKEYTILSILKTYGVFVLSFLFLYFYEASYMSMVFGLLIVTFFISIYTFYKLYKQIEFTFDFHALKYIFTYSVFLIPYALSGVIMNQIDRVMLGSMLSTHSAGIYSVAAVLGLIPMMFYVAISNSWIPNYFKYMADKNYLKIDKDIQKIILFLSGLIFILVVFADLIVKVLLNQKYYESLEVIILLAIGTYFMILWFLWGINIGYAKKTIITSIIGISSAVLNVVLNFYLIPMYELNGAVYGTLISYAFMAFSGYVASKYILKIHTTSIYDLRWSFLIVLLAFSIALINNFYLYLVFKFIIIFGAIFIIFKYKDEIKQLIQSFGIRK